MTSNHQPGHQETPAGHRPEGALLAGVCAAIAGRFGWNVWAIRGLFVFFLVIQTIATGIVYVIMAALLPRFEGRPADEDDAPANETRSDELRANELQARKERIAELERQFREMERKTGS